jgi:hypothetical protein
MYGGNKGYDSLEFASENNENPARRSNKYVGTIITTRKNLFLTVERGDFTYSMKPFKNSVVYMTQ